MHIKLFVYTLLAVLAAFVISFFLVPNADSRIVRSRAPLLEYRKNNPCPATGKLEIYTPCKGYVLDHKRPLCSGGLDAASNLVWEEYKESKLKDKQEIKLCALMKRQNISLTVSDATVCRIAKGNDWTLLARDLCRV